MPIGIKETEKEMNNNTRKMVMFLDHSTGKPKIFIDGVEHDDENLRFPLIFTIKSPPASQFERRFSMFGSNGVASDEHTIEFSDKRGVPKLDHPWRKNQDA